MGVPVGVQPAQEEDDGDRSGGCHRLATFIATTWVAGRVARASSR
jgi:hypothetical protein